MSTAAPRNSSQPALLIVEDDATLAGFVQTVLSDFLPITVHVAGSVAEARALWKDHSDEMVAILSDVNVGMDCGIALVRELTTDHADIRITLMTGHVSSCNELSSQVGKPVSLLSKPFRLSEVVAHFDWCAAVQDTSAPQSCVSSD